MSSTTKAIIYAACTLSIGLTLCLLVSVISHKPKHVALKQIDFGGSEPETYYTEQVYVDVNSRNNGDLHTTIEHKKVQGQQGFDEVVTASITTEAYKQHVKMSNISDANVKLYQIVDKYFQSYYNGKRVSPLFPLALANVETPGRANHDITWSALFPTAVVDMSLIDTFDVTYVAQDPVKYDALMHEWSTRDRGALQMSPTYGTNNSTFNALMSGTEQEKLATAQIAKGAASWASGASSSPGDRFCTQDVCLRLAASCENAIQQIKSKNLDVQNNAELITMLAMYHHRSGVWQVSGAGGWLSTQSCMNYVHHICSQQSVDTLREYYAKTNAYVLDNDVAAAILGNYTQYTTSKLEATYPIKVLYSYVVMTNKYNKG